ncbi:MAG TPA: BsuPI-related putative proteinase inhibitor [Actinomycetota bacterium]|nr:BsuPI-related putative proteinase inhibitor [Actinomycetota bacterium]
MNDPLDRLRETPGGPAADVTAIRARARRIVRRRTATLGGAAALVLVAAIGGSMLRLPSDVGDRTRLADERSLDVGSPMPESTKELGPDPGVGASAPSGTAAPIAADGSAQGATSGAAAQGTGSPPGPPLELDLSLSRKTLPAGEQVRITLSVCNPSDRPVEAAFAHGQRHDFEARRQGDDRPVWRWGAQRSFAQAVGRERWGPGECRDFTGEWSGDGDDGRPRSGRYLIVGVLTTDPPLRSGAEEVCLGECP